MEDFFVDDILVVKKKKIKSGIKGKGQERQICKILNARFADLLSKNPKMGNFQRSVGSGNRYAQANLSQVATNLYSGDIICDGFNFVIESKSGYDIDFITAFGGNKKIDVFLDQVSGDSERCGRKPLLIYKKDRMQALAFLKVLPVEKFEYKMFYRDWIVVLLEDLLKVMPDEFFFNIT